MITTVKVINISITSHSYLSSWVVRTLLSSTLSNFKYPYFYISRTEVKI